MKRKIIPTRNEVRLADDEFIVSKTDPKGRITYANRTFMRISGFPEAELLGIQHNVVRHPDMPRGVFKLLWETLERGDEFFGYVKNLCRDGSYYWVLANITPDHDMQGKLRGYYSVRRKPRAEAVTAIAALYAQMLEVERASATQDAVARSLALLQQHLAQSSSDYLSFVLDSIREGAA
ncbi:PAS domain-containing protein [Pseudomonas mangrovi]|uniref:Aerotaxis receptor Aer n=1 Tax=Pseudomonas mangrovi TaxID=2161748 RepID=A0A2T5PAX8_9PSED|nr:PAS domain-containing protein [Pseudomonas mangrovi]PTU74857.1 aerotaxis receptor Aer [Pseudomonas mangrovi]